MRAMGRFAPNLVASAAGFGVTALIGLWFTPYLIRQLGVASYGLVPLATTVTSYLAVFILVLNAAVGRNLIVALERGDLEEASRVFNTSLFGTILIVLALAAVGFGLATQVSRLFQVPPGEEQQFMWLSVLTVASFLVTQLGAPFSLTLYARNRYDLRNCLNIAANGVKVGVPVILFALLKPSVLAVGLGLLASGFVLLGGHIAGWRFLIPALRIRIRDFGWQQMIAQMAMSVWLVVGHMGNLIMLNVDLIVANRVLGALVAGQYAAVMTWSTALCSYGFMVGRIFGPKITALFARDDRTGMAVYAQRSVKFAGLMIALPVGLVCGLAKPLLHVWLGPEAEHLAPLVMLMTIHLSVNLGTQPLTNVQVATYRMRLPAFIGLAAGVLNVALAVLLSGPAGWGAYGVAAAGAIALTAWYLIFLPLHVAHILGRPWREFYRDKLSVAAATLILAALGWLCSRMFVLDSWVEVIGASAILAAVFALATYALLLTSGERRAVWAMLRIRAIQRERVSRSGGSVDS